MSDTERRLIKTKREIDSRRPKFIRPESWRYVRVYPSWRRPKGLDTKVRRRKKGWPASPNPGYRSPRAVRGLHPSEMGEVLVYNVGDLAIIDPETQVARIGGSVGGRKQVAIVDEALQRGIRVLNPGKGRAIIELEEAEAEEAQEVAVEAEIAESPAAEAVEELEAAEEAASDKVEERFREEAPEEKAEEIEVEETGAGEMEAEKE